jgi:hypothetical protein
MQSHLTQAKRAGRLEGKREGRLEGKREDRQDILQFIQGGGTMKDLITKLQSESL